MSDFRSFLASHRVFLDGGMGTELLALGLTPGVLPETWNIHHPDRVRQVHRRYFEAGSHVVYANTFGANRLKFDAEGECSLSAVITAGIQIAKEAAKEAEASGHPGPHFVALDIGACGKLLKPLGDLAFSDAISLFAEIVKIGAAAGADLIAIETMNDSYETKAAVLAAKETCDLPVIVTTVYDETGKLLTGADPLSMIAMLEGLSVDAIGMNCSLGPKEMEKLLPTFLSNASVPVIVKPNAGLPRSENGKTVFDVGPEEFASLMVEMAQSGAHVMGGCCGTTPAHLKAMIDAVKPLPYTPAVKKDISLISSYTHAVVIGGKPVMIGERINPTGKKRFKEALRAGDIPYILSEGLKQQELSVDALDVNVGLPEIDEVAMMESVVTKLQEIIDLPLQIDTTNITAMERALRLYNGKALINSVNGKQESMHAVFPLVKKYGGVVVALLLDENGIPETAEGRIAVAKKILATAREYGIDKKDLIFDPLAMAISSDDTAGLATLGAVKRLKDELDCHSILGISNVSFGLPNREWITSAFFTMCLANGLSAAIMNPNLEDMWRAYHTFNALSGRDPHCLSYLDYTARAPKPELTVKAAPDAAALKAEAPVSSAQDMFSTPGSLPYAIVRGLKDVAKTATKESLEKGAEALSLINTLLVPSLDYVGKKFEKKEMFLPQLLMSAEAAKEAFAVIKDHLSQSGSARESKGKIVLATVKGDIHDIGKNIVKVLLENYDYEVIDLGKDVPPEAVLEACLSQNVKLVGLSALMTTTVPSMAETIGLLREKAPGVLVCVGGAVLTQEYADMIGADFYGKDAMETVNYAERLYAEKRL